jgi:hypothetical protein
MKNNTIEETEAQRKFREAGEKLKSSVEGEKQVEAEGKKAALVTLESLRSRASVGMNNIGAEDIMPPQMFLVQGIKDKSELVDQNGVQCPDGKLFLKGMNEVLDSVEGYFVWVKRDTYVKEGNRWSGSKMYKTIFVRASDMLTIAVNFNKSNNASLSDLFTSKVTKNFPLFVFKTKIGIALAKNKEGIQFFKLAVTVKGIEEDPVKLTMLSTIADRFDQKSDMDIAQEVEDVKTVEKSFTNRNEEVIGPDMEDTTNFPAEVEGEDIPF